MPSTLDDKCTDFIASPISNFQRAEYPFAFVPLVESQVLIDHKEKAAALTARIKKQNLGPKIWDDSFDKSEGRIHLYAPNEGLAIPYVSPMLAESLGNLPPLLLVRTK
jgi:acetyl esterase/lipase